MGMAGGWVAPFHFTGTAVRADTPISNWGGKYWLAYTRWDGIIVTQEDLNELARGGNESLAVLESLWRYTEAGGTLLILGLERVYLLAQAVAARSLAQPVLAGPCLGQAVAATALAQQYAAEVRGNPTLVEVPAGWRRFRTSRDGFPLYTAGFGTCLVSPDRASAHWPTERWSVLDSAWNSTARPWEIIPTGNLNEDFPVVDNLGVPVRGLFVLMVVFTVLIGPVNLLFLIRHNRRIWMLWTVPLISFLTCMMVFGYMVVAEGWSGNARVAGLTILDEVEKRSVTVGRAAFYSPLTPSDGLHYSADTEVQPQGQEHSAFSSSCTLDWTDDDQHLTRGWVSARVPAHFLLRKSEPRRERVRVFREGGSLVLINHLGTDIRTVYLADEKGRMYKGSDIPAGEKAVLKPDRRELKPTDNAWRVLYTGTSWTGSMKSALSRPEEVLQPRTYVAEVEGSPFLEQGLRGARARNSPSVVLGLMADLP
jgi:hypothetical protein